jgi:hypothetical protein
MAIIAGMAYCASNLPIFSVPNSVGFFTTLIRYHSFLFSGLKATKKEEDDFVK